MPGKYPISFAENKLHYSSAPGRGVTDYIEKLSVKQRNHFTEEFNYLPLG